MRSVRGFTVLELTIAVALMGLLATLMMPSLQGYQTNSQVRSLAALLVTEARHAESDATTQQQQITWWIYGNGGHPQSWVVRQGFNQTIATGTVNPPIDLTGCYRNTFMPNGTVSEAGPCNGNPVLACVDNGQASNPFALEITIADLTEQVSVKQLSGLCPDI